MTLIEQIAYLHKCTYFSKEKDIQDNLEEIRESLKRLQKLDIELAKKAKKEKQKWAQYQLFIEHYDDFCKEYIGVSAKMNAAQGKAMKEIIAYLVKQCNTKDEPGALSAWQYILKNWNKLTKFLQNQTTLIQINKNLQEILTQLRRGANKQQANKSASSSIRNGIRRSR